MNYKTTFKALGRVDIYVIDQILKERYHNGQTILDAGCGSGRNLKWLATAKQNYPEAASNFTVGTLDNLPYGENRFDHILCCAVLHFAKNETHFTAMFSELIRVLGPNGILLIRMASNIGMDGNAPKITFKDNGQKGTYYLTRARINQLVKEFNLTPLEAVKTTNVQDERAMTTLVFQKV